MAAVALINAANAASLRCFFIKRPPPIGPDRRPNKRVNPIKLCSFARSLS
jgi:hypothetical protein